MIKLIFNGESDGSIRNILIFGALIWGLYSVTYMLLNGIVLDQIVEAAQVISGMVNYPGGHPHQIFYIKAFSLFNYLAAAVWKITSQPNLVSAFRNFSLLFLSTYVPFMITVILTRKPMWGYFAGALITSGSIIQFEGLYPIFIFPHYYSDGQIGIYLALLTIALLLSYSWMAGGFLLGLMPSLHAAMVIVVWPWSAAYLSLAKDKLTKDVRRKIITMGSLALLICGLLALIIFVISSGIKVESPYGISTNDTEVYRQFTLRSDYHRQPIPFRTIGYFLNPLAFLIIGGLLLWSSLQNRRNGLVVTDPEVISGILLLGVISLAYVYGAWSFEQITGKLPDFVQISMPNRFSNLSALLLIPISVATVASAYEQLSKKGRWLTLGLLTLLVLGEGALLILDREFVIRNLILSTWGLLFAINLHAYRSNRRSMVLILFSFLTLAVALLFYYLWTGSRVGISFAIVFLMSFVILNIGEKIVLFKNLDWHRWIGPLIKSFLIACVAVSLVALIIHVQWHKSVYTFYSYSEFDESLIKWLAIFGEPNELILTPVTYRSEIQPKTGYPVLLQLETLYMMTYRPELASEIGMMLDDFFEIDYADHNQIEQISQGGRLRLIGQIWIQSWERRSQEDWQQLGQKYGFRLILSPATSNLNLPVALSDQRWTLYVIP